MSRELDRFHFQHILHYKMSDDTRLEPLDGRQAQLLKGLAEMALLSLVDERPHYGLEILDKLRAEAGLSMAEGTVYPLLYRLERARLTHAEWRLEGAGARPRKYYALTDLGRAELARQLEDWRRISKSLGGFLERRYR